MSNTTQKYVTTHGTLTSNGKGFTSFDPTKKALTEEDKIEIENEQLRQEIKKLEAELAELRKILDE